MKKKFKIRKKRKSHNYTIIIILLLLSLFYSFNYINKLEIIISSKKYINNILNDSFNISISNLLNHINKDIFNSPIFFLKEQLKYSNESTKMVNASFNQKEKPIVYIYNSHQREQYSYKYLEDYNIVPTVLTASYMLSEKLNNYGIYTIVEENDILKYMSDNNLDHSGSYIASRYFLNKIMSEYDSINLFIDLHRDAINHNNSYIQLNGKDYAKILFVIGLENPNYQNNLKIVEKLNLIINNKYPNLSRGIMKKQGYGVNGVYNQDLNSNVILIEIGGHENNIEEVNNTLDLMAIVIKEYLNEKEEI